MNIVSLNINGAKAFYNRGVMMDFIDRFNPDILCLQETKCSSGFVPYWLQDYDPYYNFYSVSNNSKSGYSGVSILVKKSIHSYNVVIPNNFELESEYYGGRIIGLDFGDTLLLNLYVLNSGSGKEDLRDNWDELFHKYLSTIENKNLIITGDFNVCHQDIDNYNREKYYDNYPGCYEFEINNMSKLMKDFNLIDAYRELNPTKRQYTWFNPRIPNQFDNNLGWRLDYFLISKGLDYKDCLIYDDTKYSDHFPIELIL